MAFGGSGDFREDMQASALAYNLGKVSLGGGAGPAGKGRDAPAIKYELRDLEIQQTIGERPSWAPVRGFRLLAARGTSRAYVRICVLYPAFANTACTHTKAYIALPDPHLSLNQPSAAWSNGCNLYSPAKESHSFATMFVHICGRCP